MNVLTLRSFAFAAIFVVTQSASAGSLYKCIDSKGNSVYQETPCPKDAKLAGRGYIQPVAPSQSNSWVAQRGALAQQQGGQRALVEAQSGPRIQPSEDSYANNQDRQAAISHLESEKRALGTLNSRGKRELYAQMLDQQASLRGVSVPPRALRAPDPAPVYRAPNPQSTTITDQNGRTYTQPPGSTFATDNATGKQCFVNGAFVHCK